MMKPRRPHQRMLVRHCSVEIDEALNFRLDVLGRRVLKETSVRPHDMIGLALPLALSKRHLSWATECVASLICQLPQCDQLVGLFDKPDGEIASLARRFRQELEGVELRLDRQ